MTWATWLLQLAGPLAIRVLSVLGMTVMTFTGVVELVRELVTMAQSHWAALPAAVLSLASLAGVPQALGIVAGALVARVTLWAATSASRLVFK